LVGGIFKTGETRKIGLAYILRNGEFSCGRTVKISSRSNQGPQQYPQKIWGSYLKGFRSSALPKTGQVFLRRLYSSVIFRVIMSMVQYQITDLSNDRILAVK
jgi:hypothetical protein